MSELIYKENAIKTILGQYPEPHYPSWYADQIKDMPSVQLQRTSGRWIYNSPVTMKCDQCGIVIKDWDWFRFKICPGCGAKMVEPQESEVSE